MKYSILACSRDLTWDVPRAQRALEEAELRYKAAAVPGEIPINCFGCACGVDDDDDDDDDDNAGGGGGGEKIRQALYRFIDQTTLFPVFFLPRTWISMICRNDEVLFISN